ncbi:tetratricopeptide repeat protein [Streptomyces sp. RB6PN25]|uniref:Tetratricopeptide repeat protein n=1 Tax=Streptomyces humicola TaxID=2953240 RepID=A0ABT1PX55_9ACTN|nr:tetratricopeptide repeat protein [Streptomyces humicola]MCQ4082224.1 tetratricopeptide repeat protein [Streptomyces humicola]
MREEHRADAERLLEHAVAEEAGGSKRPVDEKLLLSRARAALDEIAAGAAEEYAAYLHALDAEPADPAREPLGTPLLLAGVCGATAFAIDLGQGLSGGAALTTGVAVCAAAAVATGAKTAAVRWPTARRRAALRGEPGGPEQLRLQWLTALERRGVRPWLEQQRVVMTSPLKTAKTARAAVPAQSRRSDRSAAARQRAVLAQSFAHLPQADGPFPGRHTHLSQITQWVQQARASTETKPTVVMLYGPTGSGRSALAVRAAHQLRDQFRGACVVTLRGGDQTQPREARPAMGGGGWREGEPPLSTREALLHLLNRLGAPREQLLFRERPSQEQHVKRLSEQYQKHLAGTPVVIVLDDASDPEQVRTLVPEHSDSLVLVTSAAPLDLDLPSAWVHALEVEELGSGSATELLRALASAGEGAGEGTGGQELDEDPRSAERIRQLCGGLPLALTIAGSSLGSRTLRRLADDLDAYGPLDPLERALSLRYHDQPEPSRRLLRRLAIAGRASLGAAAAAALLATEESEAARRLEELAQAGLIEHVRGSRYRLHDVVRGFAGRRLMDEEEQSERTAAQERLIRTYSELADSVIRLVDGKTSTRADTFVGGAVGSHGFPSLDQALRWLDDESSFITATLRGAEDVDQAAVLHLLGALCDYCLLRGDLYRLGEISELTQSVDQGLLMRSVQWRTGIAARQLGELDRARSTLTSVVNLYFEAQHPAGAARALCSLGITLHHQGNLQEAAAKLHEALDLQSTDELRADRAWTLHALAAVLRDQGRVGEALELLLLALELHGESESVHGQAWAHMQLGQVYVLLGQVELAETELGHAMDEYAVTRDNRGTAWTLTQLARARLVLGEADEAVRQLNEALSRHRDNEDARGEAWTLYYLGQAMEEAGDTDAGLRSLERSRTMFSRMRDVYGLACARHHSARLTRDQRARQVDNLRNSGFARQLLQDARQDFRRAGVAHGEAWSCLELAVIDAGNERIPEALDLTEEAGRLFAGIGDRRGEDWARFLRCTLLPLASEEGTKAAREDLAALVDADHEGREPALREYMQAWSVVLQRGVLPGEPWEVWRLGMTPTRSSGDRLSVQGAPTA